MLEAVVEPVFEAVVESVLEAVVVSVLEAVLVSVLESVVVSVLEAVVVSVLESVIESVLELVVEGAGFALDGEGGACFVFWLLFFYVSDDLCVDVEGAADVDHLLGIGVVDIDFHSVAHVEDAVHLAPVGLALLLYGLEEWRDGEEVVFDYVTVVGHEV